MKNRVRILLIILVIGVFCCGCSNNPSNSTPSEAPKATEAPASATPTESIEPSPTVPPTATPTEGIKFSDCLERMEPVEYEDKVDVFTVIGILDGHKVYNVLFETYEGYGPLGFAPVSMVVSKYSPSKPNIRGPLMPISLLADDDYVFVAVDAAPTQEALDSAIQEAHDRWIAEGGTEEDWLNEQKGGQVKKKVRSEAWEEATEGYIDVLYAEGCPIIGIEDYQGIYATTIISVAKLLELNDRGGETFNYVFYNKSWPRWQKEHTDQWREWRH